MGDEGTRHHRRSSPVEGAGPPGDDHRRVVEVERTGNRSPNGQPGALGVVGHDATSSRFEALRPRLQHSLTPTEVTRGANPRVYEVEKMDNANA